MSKFFSFKHPYPIEPKFERKVAYFCMEYGIDQALKIYAGGLGYLAGSHIRSAYELRQNLVGIGILWKYGYYDQVWNGDRTMGVLFLQKFYSFLEDTGIRLEINVNGAPVKVRVHYLPPEIFGTAPLFLLDTDLPENDYLARTISHRLYDSNVETKIAQYILLGSGGAKLLDSINFEPEVYHLNEAHALPAAFHLYKKLGSVEKVKERLVFTTHTPVEAGNEKHDFGMLQRMCYFQGLEMEEVRKITQVDNNVFNQSLVALRFARLSNGVSQMHGRVARKMWSGYEGTAPIIHITNSQNQKYWEDEAMREAQKAGDKKAMRTRKKEMKKRLLEEVADQTGKLFSEDVFTMVWARRFAQYKRADLITRDPARFAAMMKNSKHPVQMIWAGKPYPSDFEAIRVFNKLVEVSELYENCTVLTGYELKLSKLLKQGADVWLNTPRITREASGTSGMTAAMNGAVNFSTYDGWIPEFAKDGKNSFIIPQVDKSRLTQEEEDFEDLTNLYDILENTMLPAFYDHPDKWMTIFSNSMEDIVPFFDSGRMAAAYYSDLYAS